MKFMIKTWNYIFCFLNATYFKLFLLIGKEGYHEINIKYKLYNKRNETKYIQIDIDILEVKNSKFIVRIL